MEMEYETIAGYATDSFVERKSEFIGYIMPVTTEEAAREFIESIKKRHHDATHNVWAYVLRGDGIEIKRFSDDGEPQGTAGLPSLDVLVKEGLTDVCVVVTRYFGGILLGAGGLVRAYSHGVKVAVDAAKRVCMAQCFPVKVKLSYALYGSFQYGLPEYRHELLGTEFTDAVEVSVLLHHTEVERFCAWMVELSGGACVPEVGEMEFAAIGC